MEFVKHSTVNSMAQLASTYRNQGWLDAAEELEVQLREMRKKKLGEGHLDTLISMNNLAFTWEGQGRCAEAVSLMLDVPATLSIRISSPLPKRWLKGKRGIEECVQSRKRVLGLDYPHALSFSTSLATWKAGQEDIVLSV